MSFLTRLFRRDQPAALAAMEPASAGGAAAPPEATAEQSAPQPSMSGAEQSAPQPSMSVQAGQAGGNPTMAVQDEGATYSEAQIAVHWREEEYYPAPPKFIGQANVSDPSIFERFRGELS